MKKLLPFIICLATAASWAQQSASSGSGSAVPATAAGARTAVATGSAAAQSRTTGGGAVGVVRQQGLGTVNRSTISGTLQQPSGTLQQGSSGTLLEPVPTDVEGRIPVGANFVPRTNVQQNVLTEARPPSLGTNAAGDITGPATPLIPESSIGTIQSQPTIVESSGATRAVPAGSVTVEEQSQRLAESRAFDENLRAAVFTSGTTTLVLPDSTRRITVTSEFGRITLRGDVGSEAQARDVETRVLGLAEGVQIDNQLIVVRQATPVSTQNLS